SGTDVSLRGISAVDDQCCWASGAKGAVLRTIDGGASWSSVGPPDADKADFRDIEAWDANTAVIMSAGDVDRLYRTTDGGKSWSIVYEHPDATAFFDGMAVSADRKSGILMGDPIDGHMMLLQTNDAGASWKLVGQTNCPRLPKGLAAFAASGTHLTWTGTDSFVIGLGGIAESEPQSVNSLAMLSPSGGLRLDSDSSSGDSNSDTKPAWTTATLPMKPGASSGVFSIAQSEKNADRLIAVGGDYQKADVIEGNVALSDDRGKTWRLPTATPPSGFRSVVAVVPVNESREYLIAAGPSGTDASADGGETWKRVSATGFHTVSVALPKSDPPSSVPKFAIWAAGSEGRIARWKAQPKFE
ncbi:MAG: hypothetical protein JNM43_10710, partial [Planctomycetaceae bacterium]|nr:hypothetical protein [Planctomycetaceae bacterium]